MQAAFHRLLGMAPGIRNWRLLLHSSSNFRSVNNVISVRSSTDVASDSCRYMALAALSSDLVALMIVLGSKGLSIVSASSYSS